MYSYPFENQILPKIHIKPQKTEADFSVSVPLCGFYAEYRTIQEHYRVFADICVAFPEFEILP